jgi:site-specific DNA-methyltransferase (adenine-specific)
MQRQREIRSVPKKAGRHPNPLQDVVLGHEALVPLKLMFRDDAHSVWLYRGNCLEVLDALNVKYPHGCFDMIFADPPYFLSNGGITCHSGRMVRVDKGEWDKSRGIEENHNFNRAWLERCQKILKPNGTIWVTGTHHVVFSVGHATISLGKNPIHHQISHVDTSPTRSKRCYGLRRMKRVNTCSITSSCANKQGENR